MMNAPLGTNSPGLGVLLTWSGYTQNAPPSDMAAIQAFDWARANWQACLSSSGDAFAPSFTTTDGAPWTSAWA